MARNECEIGAYAGGKASYVGNNVGEKTSHIGKNVGEIMGHVDENVGEKTGHIGKNVSEISTYVGDSPQECIVELLSNDPTLSAAKLAEKFGLSKRHVERLLAELRDAGAIERSGSARGGHWIVRR